MSTPSRLPIPRSPRGARRRRRRSLRQRRRRRAGGVRRDGDRLGALPGVRAFVTEAVLSAETVFAPVRSQTAFEETVERLGTAIKLGLLPPGTRLPAERELCARLGIARSTLRQALTALTESGHVFATRGRRGGTFVADPQPPADPPSPEMLARWRETCDQRLAVELGVALLAAERAQPADLATLDELAAALEQSAGGLRRLPPGRHPPARRPRRSRRLAEPRARDDRDAGRDDRPDRLHRAPAAGARVLQRAAPPLLRPCARATPSARCARWPSTCRAPSTCSRGCCRTAELRRLWTAVRAPRVRNLVCLLLTSIRDRAYRHDRRNDEQTFTPGGPSA